MIKTEITIFVNRRLFHALETKDIKFDIVFSACFDYDIFSLSLSMYSSCTNVPHVHNIASQSMGKVYFETF